MPAEASRNRFQLLIAPEDGDTLWINQDAYVSIADIAAWHAFNMPGRGIVAVFICS